MGPIGMFCVLKRYNCYLDCSGNRFFFFFCPFYTWTQNNLYTVKFDILYEIFSIYFHHPPCSSHMLIFMRCTDVFAVELFCFWRTKKEFLCIETLSLCMSAKAKKNRFLSAFRCICVVWLFFFHCRMESGKHSYQNYGSRTEMQAINFNKLTTNTCFILMNHSYSETSLHAIDSCSPFLSPLLSHQRLIEKSRNSLCLKLFNCNASTNETKQSIGNLLSFCRNQSQSAYKWNHFLHFIANL